MTHHEVADEALVHVTAQLKADDYSDVTLAVDPGLLSGVAVTAIRVRDNELVTLYSAELGFPDVALVCRALTSSELLSRVVAEKFTITPQTGKNSQAGWSLEIIGCLKFFAWEAALPLVFQSPASAKSFATNDRLKQLGMWHKGGAGHANDALRHAVVSHVKNAWTHANLIAED